jgi:transposase
MFIRPVHVTKNGKRHAYWALVESYRTERGPRQRTVAYLGKLEDELRRGVKDAAEGNGPAHQSDLFEKTKPKWVEVDTSRVRVERCRDFGGPWLALELARRVGFVDFLRETIPPGREDVPWPLMAMALVAARLCEPSSELHIAEHLYASSGLSDLLGVPPQKVNDDRLYRALDALLPHKEQLETFLKQRLGRLFDLSYEFMLYDVTSTYFEGEAEENVLAQYGYSRDKRPDCKQVCIALVVAEGGMPIGYEMFPGSTADVTTVREVVEQMESRYGRAERVWVMDRGMISSENLQFLREGGRRYIVGTPRGELKRFERELLEGPWQRVREGLEVKLCAGPGGEETFILCRSRARADKEKAMRARFEKRIEEGLRKIEASCAKRRWKVVRIAKRVGRLMQKNSRAAGLFETDVVERADGAAQLRWRKREQWRQWAELSQGCYLLRSNIRDWTPERLWEAYIQLTEAEAAFRIQKSDLRIRPIWHQREDRVRAHVLVCFLAYVLWKTLAQMCRQAGLGQEPRRVFEELGKLKIVDVILPTRRGIEIRKRCVTQPTDHQAILLQRLGLQLPKSIEIAEV